MGALERLVGRQTRQFLVLEGAFGVEQADLAVAETSGRPRLSAVLWPLDAHGSEVFQILVNESIENPWLIADVDKVSTLGINGYAYH